MGNVLTRLVARLFGSKEIRVLMLGLDAAGKTTILSRLKLGEAVSTVPTVGFNVESVAFRNVKFNVWDVGGQDKIRPLWRHYFTGTQALIYVIDSSDTARLPESKQELVRILSDREMKNCLVLVLANKQDSQGALAPEAISEQFELSGLLSKRGKPWTILPVEAKTGKGLNDGLAWIEANLPK
ncbi:ADP-ribosylation factor family-domain-containing protein [Myxozyma melibiosi]|uniref:ADP-ribosylation factor family-domain-containing protein n=1 Tax=Myxozyma melibiosi TaxID=54550 RepID=A0ABR1FA63_9ASCO